MQNGIDKAKETIDNVFGAGTSDKVEGKGENLVGKVKETIGSATDNKQLETEGQAQQAEGIAHEALGAIKGAAETVVDAVVEGAHKLGDVVSHAIKKNQDDDDSK